MCSIVLLCFLLKRNGTWSTSLGVSSGLSRWVSIPEEGLQPHAPYAVWEKPRMPRRIEFINTSSPHVTTSTYQLRFEFVSNCTVAKPVLSHFKRPWTNSESYVDVAWCCHFHAFPNFMLQVAEKCQSTVLLRYVGCCFRALAAATSATRAIRLLYALNRFWVNGMARPCRPII